MNYIIVNNRKATFMLRCARQGVGVSLSESLRSSNDMAEIARHGVCATPAIIMEDQVKFGGKVPAKSEINTWLE
jgi:hypothetical protein